ncbi:MULTISPECIES: ATP-binding protein [unclassified Mesorhizobium]|uniref:ATP-binding protein n=1 Tax=unclassified Mesorhizobium TaxID=325217 RepID=UPI002484978F|nr:MULTISPECIES: ATP-binding protein [unclassified Mesorhizobium]
MLSPISSASTSSKIVEERYQRKSTLITAQVPVASWHDLINDSTVADAIHDRSCTMHTASPFRARASEEKSLAPLDRLREHRNQSALQQPGCRGPTSTNCRTFVKTLSGN